MTSTNSIDTLLENALTEFHAALMKTKGNWFGKERDCVNRFVMGHLLPACLSGHYVVKDPSQIGIEMPVAQPKKFGVRPSANKDVVIWHNRCSTCWNQVLKPVNAPLAVLEWKVQHPKSAKQSIHDATSHDRQWLGAFTAEQTRSVGYSVFLKWNREWAPETLVVARCVSGRWSDNWFVSK